MFYKVYDWEGMEEEHEKDAESCFIFTLRVLRVLCSFSVDLGQGMKTKDFSFHTSCVYVLQVDSNHRLQVRIPNCIDSGYLSHRLTLEWALR